MKKSTKPDMPVIAGCLRGLGSTLVNFTQAVDEGKVQSCDAGTSGGARVGGARGQEQFWRNRRCLFRLAE